MMSDASAPSPSEASREGELPRVVVVGRVMERPFPCPHDNSEDMFEFALDVAAGARVETWIVYVTKADGGDEVGSLEIGDMVAAAGIADPDFHVGAIHSPWIRADRLHSMMPRDAADRAAVPAPTADANPSIERVALLARASATQAERDRIAAIMNSRFARDQLKLAWHMAERGDITLAQAEEALSIGMLGMIAPAIGADGAVLEN